MIEKYINEDGKVGVLVSYGYGAGWSTWSYSSEFFAMDKTLVQMKLDGATEEDVNTYLNTCDIEESSTSGWDDCEVEWLDKGQNFRIDDYDGNESLITVDELTLTA